MHSGRDFLLQSDSLAPEKCPEIKNTRGISPPATPAPPGVSLKKVIRRTRNERSGRWGECHVPLFHFRRPVNAAEPIHSVLFRGSASINLIGLVPGKNW